MLTLLFLCLMFSVFGKMAVLAFKATWGIGKIIFSIILAPLFLIGLFFSGLVNLAIPVLLIIGAVTLLGSLAGN